MNNNNEINNNSFTIEQNNLINKLRSNLNDLNNNENEYGQVYLLEDSTIWRYILAKSREENSLEKSEEMFRLSILWRKEINMNNLLNEWRNKENNYKPSTIRSKLGDLCLYTNIFEKRSKNGGPIMIEKIGKLDLLGLSADSYAFENTCNSYIVYLEECWNIVRQYPNSLVGGVMIIDISDCGFSFMSSISVLKELCSTGIMRYAEISEKIFIINAGWLITTLWSAVKPFIPTRTEEKLKILGTNYQQELSDYLFEDQSKLEDMALFESTLNNYEVFTVEDAYTTLLNEVLQNYNESTGTVDFQYSDSIDFLKNTINYIQKNPRSKLSNRVKEIEKCLSIVESNEEKNSS